MLGALSLNRPLLSLCKSLLHSRRSLMVNQVVTKRQLTLFSIRS